MTSELIPVVVHAEVDTAPSPEDRAVYAWLDAQKSAHTVRSYTESMRQWREWLSSRGVPLAGPRRQDADAWRNHLADVKKRKPKTVDSRLIAVRSFYDYLVGEGALDVNPIKGAKLLNQGPHQQTHALDEDEVKRLSVAAKAVGPWRRFLVLFLATTGCRISEALGVRVEDIGKSSGVPVATLTRKGGERGDVPLDGTLHEMLIEYMSGLEPTAYVFSKDGGLTPVTYSAARFAIGLIGRKAGLAGVHPHVLRATLITILLDKEKPVDRVQALVGHRKTDTTRSYDRGKGKLKRLLDLTATMAQVADLD